MISKFLSTKFKILSVVAMMAVLYMHSFFIESSQWEWVGFIQTAVNHLTRFAVPTFFIISGYLFFNNVTDPADIYPRIKKRTRTLLIPYLFWCTVFIVIVALGSLMIKSNTEYFLLLSERDYLGFIKYIFWAPAAFHLWYVKDLYLIVLTSPILYVVLKKYPFTILALLFILNVAGVFMPFTQGLFYFSIGATYALKSCEPFENLNPYMALGSLVLSQFLIDNTPPIHSIGVFLLTISIWRLYDKVEPYLHRTIILKLSGYSFFIYCAHIPLLTFIKSIIHPRLIDSALGCMLAFVVSPIACIIILWYIIKLWKGIFPKFYSMITGGR